jgi:hypothetical protein
MARIVLAVVVAATAVTPENDVIALTAVAAVAAVVVVVVVGVAAAGIVVPSDPVESAETVVAVPTELLVLTALRDRVSLNPLGPVR